MPISISRRTHGNGAISRVYPNGLTPFHCPYKGKTIIPETEYRSQETKYKMCMDERYTRMSYTEIIRVLIQEGLNHLEAETRPA